MKTKLRVVFRRTNDKTAQARAWLAHHFDLNCDKMPGCTNNKQVWHLMAGTTKQEIYDLYVQWCEAPDGVGREQVISCKYFLRVWAKEFPHVTIPEKGRFKMCST